jgi:FMN hydrolase / 5-amino-6-(5-phospho-D-ribitylamino)uracil phosphatase
VVRLQGDLSGERREVSGLAGAPIRAITLDFGNTLVPVTAAGLRAVVDATADRVAGPFRVDRGAFLAAWQEERDRQFREDVPQFREADMTIRFARVLARLRGFAAPAPGATWDDTAAAARSAAAEIAFGVEAYARAFVDGLPPDPLVEPLLARLAARFPLAILSNWPLAVSIERYVEAAGWAPHLSALVVSQRVGTIKPDLRIFRAAEAALRDVARAHGEEPPLPGEILHVGDDWAADVVGAAGAGWQAAWLRSRPGDSPLPGSAPDDSVVPALVLDRFDDLKGVLDPARRPWEDCIRL